jgi:hypothetical protein
MVTMRRSLSIVLLILMGRAGPAAAEWKPADGPLMTRWAGQVTPDNVWPEYPRPQMVRQQWTSLNGLWDYAITAMDATQPDTWEGQILVPFCAESALSGVMKPVTPEQALWYHRTFQTPELDGGKRLLLHFGAVDWRAIVWLNGAKMGEHTGGYDPFTFDITDHLRKDGNELVVRVWDPTNAGFQPRGKQVLEPGGIWYTAVTGIWQTVWLEPVPASYIRSLKITPDVDRSCVTISVEASNPVESAALEVEAPAGGRVVPTNDPTRVVVKVDDPKLWSPDTPHLYDLTLTLGQDRVDSYFALRKIEVRKDEAGINRLFLNGKPLFQYGPLDQGWWPDGLYTPPCDAALKHDVETTKKMGMNMCRKHVKIEHPRFYYWADKLGLLIWQDMPSGDKYIRGQMPDITRSEESAENFERELKAMIDTYHNHPSIVMWVAYNEGWGQWDTPRICELIRQQDPTRLVNNASGWTDRGVGDVLDIHRYPGPGIAPLEDNRAVVLGEFGGLGLQVDGHLWKKDKNWGYRSFKSAEELTDAYVDLLHRLHPLIGSGLAAAVYTQTSDVEIEVNGLMTYDRAMVKMDMDRAREAVDRLHQPPPVIKPLVPTSQVEPQTWRYTTDQPADDWFKPGFDDSAWKAAPGGFGRNGTPGAVIATQWHGPDIWVRRLFALDTIPEDVQLLIHHDEDAEVYLNGVLAANLPGYARDYLTARIRPEARKTLRTGENVIAIHCRQTTGGQFIDAGLVSVEQP